MKPEYVTVCARCGSPLTQPDVALAVRGILIDFIARAVSEEDNLEVCYCLGCRNAMQELCKGGIPAALARMKEANL